MIKRKGPTSCRYDKGKTIAGDPAIYDPIGHRKCFQQLYNTADTIIVGRYVGGALAAVGSTERSCF